MYCPSCGSTITPGLSYCNRCGNELSAKKGDSSKIQVPESLVWAIVAVSVGGLALIIGLMAVMKAELHFETPLIVGFTLLSFLTLLVAEIVFVWLIMKHARSLDRNKDAITPLVSSTAKELGEVRERFLNEPALSVTEQTTRTLETVQRERTPN